MGDRNRDQTPDSEQRDVEQVDQGRARDIEHIEDDMPPAEDDGVTPNGDIGGVTEDPAAP